MSKRIPPTLYDEIFPCSMKMEHLLVLIQKRYECLKEIEQSNFARGLDHTFIPASVNIHFSWNTQEGIMNDLASHFILSLVYCKYDSDRSWFCLQESRLFQNRLISGKEYDIPETLKKMGIPLYPYENHLDKDLYEKINFKSLFIEQQKQTQKEKLLFIPFQYALKLIPTKKYFIHKGNIYVSESEVASLIENVFFESSMLQLLKIHTQFEILFGDSRIKYILLQFEKFRELKSAQKTNNETISNEFQVKTGKDIDTIAERAFPLCMLMIQRHINQNAHLKHIGRLQYTLFLKGIGLPLEEALAFFKRKYERKTTGDKFEKMYAYNIRHTYGLEGKRSDYSSYSCKKIMMSFQNPSSDECHGCPFKTYTEDAIKRLLFSLNFKEKDVLTILDKKQTNEFPICCIRSFEAKFPGYQYEKVGENPLHYFTSAMKSMSKKKIEYEKGKGKDNTFNSATKDNNSNKDTSSKSNTEIKNSEDQTKRDPVLEEDIKMAIEQIEEQINK